MKVCRDCARFGEKVRESPAQGKGGIPKKRKTPKPQGPTLEVVEDYPEIIRNARERKRLTQEDLGNRINEKTSVINRLEGGKMRPSIGLAKTLEKALEVSLLEETQEASPSQYGKGKKEDLTIGDIIDVKKNR